MKRAIYPGSFDPFTLGHLDILQRVVGIFDEITVAVLHNPNKKPLFTVAERIDLIKEATEHMGHVVVDSFEGLVVDYAKIKGATTLVRGLREVSDFENELKMAHMNRHLDSDVGTVFIPTSPEYSFVSSSLVKEVASHGGRVTAFVPSGVEQALYQKYQKV